MGSFSGRVVGGAGVQRNIRALIAAAGPRTLKTAATAGAIPMQNSWKGHCAVETGTYRRSVHIGGVTQPESGGDDAHVKAREDVPGPDEGPTHVVVTIGTDIVDPPYPVFLEDGTAHMAAQPAAQPAFDETAHQSEAEMVAVVKLALEGATRL